MGLQGVFQRLVRLAKGCFWYAAVVFITKGSGKAHRDTVVSCAAVRFDFVKQVLVKQYPQLSGGFIILLCLKTNTNNASITIKSI